MITLLNHFLIKIIYSFKKSIFSIILTTLFIPINLKAQEPEWSFIKGYDILPYFPVYGTRGGLANSENTPGARKNATTWIIGTKFYLFGGSGYSATGTNSYLNDLWEYDLISNNWRWLKGNNNNDSFGIYGTKGVASSNNYPGARIESVSWESNGKLYLFGGTGIATQSTIGSLNDLWVFDLQTENWTWLSGDNTTSQFGNYGTLNIPASTNKPGSRANSVAWVNSGKLYMFGGNGAGLSGFGTLNDLWEYNISTQTWTWINGTGLVNQLGVYGTKNTASANNLPGGREDAVGWISDNKLYLFGGRGYASTNSIGGLNDLWRYDIATNQWVWINGINNTGQSGNYGTLNVEASTNTPGGKANSQSWTIGNKLYLFGGYEPPFTRDNNDLWVYDLTTNNWTWIKGSNIFNQSGVYGTQGVFGSNNTPSSRQGTNGVQYNGKLYLFGGFNASSNDKIYNDVWEFDLTNLNWKWVKGSNIISQNGLYGSIKIPNASNQPGARQNATTWVSNNKYYLFGGMGYSENGALGTLNDLWEFDPITQNWTWLKGPKEGSSGSYGTKLISDATNNPSKRDRAAGWEKDGKLYLFGGRDNLFYDDLWEYNIATGNWTWIKGSSNGGFTPNFGILNVVNETNNPGGRQESATWVLGNKLFLFGGNVSVSGGRIFNDLWEFDLSTYNWKWIKGSNIDSQNGFYGTTGVYNNANIPGARSRATAWVSNNRVFIFGGSGFAESTFGLLNDLWEYDTINNNFRWIKGTKSGSFQYGTYGTMGVANVNNTPGGRSDAVSWNIGEKLYLLGGDGYTIFSPNTVNNLKLNDLWEFDIQTGNWKWLKGSNSTISTNFYVTKNEFNISNNLGSRSNAKGGFISDKYYIFGGFGYGRNGDINYRSDLWSLKLNSNLTTSISRNKELSLFKIYPNPVDKVININIGYYLDKNLEISLLDLTGKVIYSETVQIKADKSTHQLQLNQMPKTGHYIINIKGRSVNNSYKVLIL